MINPADVIRSDPSDPPVLMVVIDTEEEFDWSAPHSRTQTGVQAMRQIEAGQAIFDKLGLRPCYVADYPVAVQQEGYRPLREVHSSGRCVVGAHLHPWVNPPHCESVNFQNSFPGNLPRTIEQAKLAELVHRLEEEFEQPIQVYKAGRYGFGPRTGEILAEMGFLVDLSPAPPYNYETSKGPNFDRYPNDPFWINREKRLLSFPCTGAFIGGLSGVGYRVYPWATSGAYARLRVPGVLARLRLLERIRLSPEGFSLDDMIRLTRALLRSGTKVLTLSFHSPSLAPGHTPYVRNAAELSSFLGRLEDYLNFFVEDVGGVFKTPLEVHAALTEQSG